MVLNVISINFIIFQKYIADLSIRFMVNLMSDYAYQNIGQQRYCKYQCTGKSVLKHFECLSLKVMDLYYLLRIIGNELLLNNYSVIFMTNLLEFGFNRNLTNININNCKGILKFVNWFEDYTQLFTTFLLNKQSDLFYTQYNSPLIIFIPYHLYLDSFLTSRSSK